MFHVRSGFAFTVESLSGPPYLDCKIRTDVILAPGFRDRNGNQHVYPEIRTLEMRHSGPFSPCENELSKCFCSHRDVGGVSSAHCRFLHSKFFSAAMFL